MAAETSTSASRRIVVVGAGQAGGDAVAALRMAGHTGPLTLIGDEPTLPYSRPPLSKAYLAGDATDEDLALRDREIYEKQSIDVRLARRAIQLRRDTQTVRLDDGTLIPYDTLILATGGSARTLDSPDLAYASNVHSLRTDADARRLRSSLATASRLTIIGGGYIGLEIAAAARAHGVDVTILEAAPRVLARVTAPVMSDFFQRVHREEGVEIILEARISGFETNKHGNVTAVRLEDGSRIPADAVLVGIGLNPRVELAEAAGIAIDNGIVVDEFMRTSDPHVYAIGDVARHPDPQHGGTRRLESVPNASEQARVAAASILGTPRPYDALPWFWSDQYDLKLQVAGLSVRYDTIVSRPGDNPRQITSLYLRDGVIISADVVNRPTDFAIAKKLIAAGSTVDLERLNRPDVPLKEFLSPSRLSAV